MSRHASQTNLRCCARLPLLGAALLSFACGEGSLSPEMAAAQRRPPDLDEPTDTPAPAAPPPPLSDLGPADILFEGEPPAPDVERPASVLSTGFFVSGGRVYDPFGKEFVFRGLNNAHIWFDTGGRMLALDALEEIAAYGFNSVRIVWETDAMNGGATPALLDTVIGRVLSLGMVPMVELHDVTGDETNERLLDMAEYYTSAGVIDVLLKWEQMLVVNIANEWSGDDYFNGYRAAIEHLRGGGVNHLLVIDANGYGQNAASVLQNGQALLDADPQHNLLFSVHMYGNYTGAMGPTRVTNALNQAADLGLPLIVGEFGWQAGNQTLRPIDFGHILAECNRHGFGYLPWSWKGNGGNVTYLDMAMDWPGQELSQWGRDLINDPNGIAATAVPASFFRAQLQ